MIWKVTNDDKEKDGMLYILQTGIKNEFKIVFIKNNN